MRTHLGIQGLLSVCLLSLPLVLLSIAGVFAQPAAPELSISGDASAGHLRAVWIAPGDDANYEFQQATRADFNDAQTVYRGPHTASVLSGLTDGTLYLRARTIIGSKPGPWSEVRKFTVHHHSRQLAFGFLFAGAIVFIATLSFLIHFSRRVADD